MSLLLVLNELSYRNVKAHRDQVSASLRNLVSVLLRIRRHRTDVSMVTEANFFDLALTDGYSVREWAGDGRNRDALRVLRGLRNRAPFRAVTPDELYGETDYFLNGQPANGLGTAYLMGGIGLSLALSALWDAAWLSVLQRSLAEADNGNAVLTDSEVKVRHASVPEHVDEHQRWMLDSELGRIYTGSRLWDIRDEIFPHLRFLPRVADDLNGLSVASLNQVKERLAELEETAAEWRQTGAAAPAWRSKVTPDSDSRKELCRFTDTDGVTYLFDWHARFTPGAGRLHFRMEAATRTLVIAYVGWKIR